MEPRVRGNDAKLAGGPSVLAIFVALSTLPRIAASHKQDVKCESGRSTRFSAIYLFIRNKRYNGHPSPPPRGAAFPRMHRQPGCWQGRFVETCSGRRSADSALTQGRPVESLHTACSGLFNQLEKR